MKTSEAPNGRWHHVWAAVIPTTTISCGVPFPRVRRCGSPRNMNKSKKGQIMKKYQKPQIVAKSAPKQTFVAGCPEKTAAYTTCTTINNKCLCGPLK